MNADQQARGSLAAGVPLRRNRDFNLLWAGQAVSGFGSQLSGIAYPLLVLAMTGSAAKAGLVGSASLITNLILLLPAGVVSDRYPRRRIMVTTGLVQMGAVGSVAGVTLTHHVFIAQLAAVGAVQGAASAFYLGASRGALRRVVPASQLSQAYGRALARDEAVSLAGPPAGGALFAVAKFLPFAGDSLSYGLIALAAALIRTPLEAADRAAGARGPLLRNVSAGLRFVLARPLLRIIAVWGAAVNAVAAGMLLLVIVLARHRGASSEVIGLLLSINAASGLIGALGAPRLIGLVGGRNLALITSWLLPAGAVCIAFAPSVWLIGVIGGVTTLTITPVNVAFAAYSAEVTPDHLQAQAGNAMQLCVNCLAWLAVPAGGLLADTLGVRAAIGVAAALYVLIAAGVQLSARQLTELDRNRAWHGQDIPSE